MRLYPSPIKSLSALLALLVLSATALAQGNATGSLRVQVADELGGVVVGASVTLTDAKGAAKTATTNGEGSYIFSNLAAGVYTVRATANGFGLYENTEVNITAGQRADLSVTLKVAIEEQKVTVSGQTGVSTDAENNANQLVLSGKDLDALPDDPDELAAALLALAGPQAGPNGGQIFIDGFAGGRLPPKDAIREIRINQNPFTAENDQPGGGGISILTRPGTDKIRGGVFMNFNDESLNSRNPFANRRADFQVRQFGGNLAGPIQKGKSSFFLDFMRREVDDNEIVVATILDPALNVVGFNQAILTPNRLTTFSPRLDYQINRNNTLVARYSFFRTTAENAGVTGFSLPSRAINSETTQHLFQFTETAVLSQTVINETRFQFTRNRNEQQSNNNAPALVVSDAFIGGGPQLGLSFGDNDRWELTNTTSWIQGRHTLKAGGRLRGVHTRNTSQSNFGGTYTFTGGFGPRLDANNQVVLVNGQPDIISLTSLERYRRTLLFQKQGLTSAQIRALGGGAAQLSINGGNPESSVSQVDFGGFIQDDWRVRPNFTLSMGLRYETQSNIHSPFNFGPRIAVAWQPGGGGNNARPPKTVVRAGYGVFYNRVGENLTLDARRLNGTNQQQFIVNERLPNSTQILDLFPVVPTVATLNTFALPQTIRRVASDLTSPYFIVGGVQIERQLPLRTTMYVLIGNFRARHLLRSRNINAPLPATGLRPDPNSGNVYQYESSGNYELNQVSVGFNMRLAPGTTLFGSYNLGKAKSDTDGPFSFPVNQYDASEEYAAAGGGFFQPDIRHRVTLAGSVTLPWKRITLNPFIIANSGVPYNIIIGGRDINGDNIINERPSFALDKNSPECRKFQRACFNTSPIAGQEIIPRNFGRGPAFFSVNLRVGRTFGFGEMPGAKAKAAAAQTPGKTGPSDILGGGAAKGPAPLLTPQKSSNTPVEKRYNLNVSVNFQNIFNRTNLGQPVGNLSSPLYGFSTRSAPVNFGDTGGSVAAGNRRITMSIRLNF